MSSLFSIVWARLDYGSVRPIHTLMGLTFGWHHGPTSFSTIYKFWFSKPLLCSAREFQRENGVFFGSETVLTCELLLLLLQRNVIVYIVFDFFFLWFSHWFVCVNLLILHASFVSFSIMYVWHCDVNFRLQLISSAYQRCRLSEQICRLAVILTRSSFSHPSLQISSKKMFASICEFCY